MVAFGLRPLQARLEPNGPRFTLHQSLMAVSVVAAPRLIRWTLLLAALACVYVNYWYNAHPPAGALDNGRMSARHPTPLTPAGYAFSIWGVIFIGLLAYSLWQLLPAQRRETWIAQVNGPLTLAVLATGCWTLVFSYELLGLSLAVMLGILATLAVAYGRARRSVLAGEAPGWPLWFLGLYLGWISLATVLNATFGLRDAVGVSWPADWSAAACYALVAVAAGLGLALAVRFRDPLPPLAIAWGLAGTCVARRAEAPGLALAAAVAAGALALGGLWLGRRRRAA